jgi:hypothetical protein
MISQDDAKDHDSPWAELIQQSLGNPGIGKISAYRREFPVYPGSENCIYTIDADSFCAPSRNLQTKEIADAKHCSRNIAERSIALCRLVRPKRAVCPKPERSPGTA